MLDVIGGVARLLLEIGLEVYKAVKAGDTHRTVGEIFANVQMDSAVIAELDALAAAHYAAKNP
jgi:hypothetical protein